MEYVLGVDAYYFRLLLNTNLRLCCTRTFRDVPFRFFRELGPLVLRDGFIGFESWAKATGWGWWVARRQPPKDAIEDHHDKAEQRETEPRGTGA